MRNERYVYGDWGIFVNRRYTTWWGDRGLIVTIGVKNAIDHGACAVHLRRCSCEGLCSTNEIFNYIVLKIWRVG